MTPSTGTAHVPHVVIRARPGWQVINLAEIIAYRDLFFFLVWRDIKVRYAQSILGIGWAVIQPVFQAGIFTLIFGKVANLETPHGWDYGLFALCATVPWTFFSNAFSEASSSLVGNAAMISKVYFPRLILPFSSVLGKLVDLAIGLVMIAVVFAFRGHLPDGNVLWLPLLILLMVMSAAGLGMWMTALAIQYRDVRYALTFLVQLLMWGSPVAYSTESLATKFPGFEHLYALNPMVGVIEGFRAALLGGASMPWDLIGISAVVSGGLLVMGALYFRKMERVFSDVA